MNFLPPIFTRMKLNRTRKRIIIAALFFMVAMMETGWVGVIYRKESQTFGKEMEHIITDAILNEIWERRGKEDYYLDIRWKTKMFLTYQIDGTSFQIFTDRKLVETYLNRTFYDFARKEWSIDSMLSDFRRYNPYPELTITFTRRDPAGRVMDCASLGSGKAEGKPTLTPFQLGNVYADTLESRFRLPFAVFWQRQRAGLVLSCLLLLLTGAYGWLLAAKERRERSLLSMLDRQLAVAHDLKTPICSNRHIEEELAARIAAGETGQAAMQVASALELSRQMATDARILTAPFPGEEDASPAPERFDLRRLIEGIVARHASLSGRHIAFTFEGSSPYATGDPFHLRHWTENLLANAVQHSSGNGGISVRCRQGKGGRITLSVSDRGQGMGRKIRQRLPRTGSPDMHSPENSGWGLPYIRRTLRLYGGRMRIATRRGKGTTCTLVFHPGKRRRHPRLPRHAYHWFTALAVVAGATWLAAGIHAERHDFLLRESRLLAEAIQKANDAVFLFRPDTTDFKNNYAAQTVTIRRNFVDKTISMGDYTNQLDLYVRLLYDLRDERWRTDSVESWYRRLSANRAPLLLVRQDSTGTCLDRTAATEAPIDLPLRDTLPLGFVEGHRLEAQWAFPWETSLARQGGWIAISLVMAGFALWLGSLLSHYDRRRQAFIRFQQEKVQGIMNRVAAGLQETGKAEEEMAETLARGDTQGLATQLQENIARYKRLLHRINYLLDQMTAWQRL